MEREKNDSIQLIKIYNYVAYVIKMRAQNEN